MGNWSRTPDGSRYNKKEVLKTSFLFV